MVVTTSVVPVAPPSPAPAPAFDTAAVRELLMAAFSDEEFTTFCYDCFRPAYDAFSIEMSRRRKTQILVEHCERQGRMEELLAKIKRANPYQYGQLKNRLRNGDPPPNPKPSPEPPPNPFAGATTVKDPTPAFDAATERELPMTAFIEADRKARFDKKKVEPPQEPPKPPKGPIIDGPIIDGPIITEPPEEEEEPEEESEETPEPLIIEPPVIPVVETPKKEEEPKKEPVNWRGLSVILIAAGAIIGLLALLVPTTSSINSSAELVASIIIFLLGVTLLLKHPI
ncbi:MAG: hypothetical protein NT169_18010 [Chloroflexi bacterium]|nr:hypothetical protein [Chloroflexota bacterium]